MKHNNILDFQSCQTQGLGSSAKKRSGFKSGRRRRLRSVKKGSKNQQKENVTAIQVTIRKSDQYKFKRTDSDCLFSAKNKKGEVTLISVKNTYTENKKLKELLKEKQQKIRDLQTQTKMEMEVFEKSLKETTHLRNLELQTKLTDHISEISILRLENENYRNENTILETQIEHLKKDLIESNLKIDTQKNYFEEDQINIDAKKSLEKVWEGTKNEVTELTQKIENLKENERNLKEILKSREVEISESEKKYQQSEDRVIELETQISDLLQIESQYEEASSSQIRVLQTEIKIGLDAQRDLTSKLTAQNTMIQQQQLKLLEIQKSKAQILQLEGDLAECKSQLLKQISLIKEKDLALEISKQDSASLRDASFLLKNDLNRKEQKIQDLKVENSIFQNQQKQHRIKVGQMSEEIRDLSCTVETLRMVNSKYKKYWTVQHPIS